MIILQEPSCILTNARSGLASRSFSPTFQSIPWTAAHTLMSSRSGGGLTTLQPPPPPLKIIFILLRYTWINSFLLYFLLLVNNYPVMFCPLSFCLVFFRFVFSVEVFSPNDISRRYTALPPFPEGYFPVNCIYPCCLTLVSLLPPTVHRYCIP
jgi:hypothetical protein